MKLVLIRHPQPEVAAGICYGRTDLALRGSANVTAQTLSAKLHTPSYIACSPLLRCKALGLALAALHPLCVLAFDDRLQEIDFGTWEMQPWDGIGKTAMDAWIASGFAAHHGGESLQTLDARVANWLGSAQQLVAANQTLWAVTHAGVIRSVLRQKNMCSFEASLAWPIPYGEFIEFNLE